MQRQNKVQRVISTGQRIQTYSQLWSDLKCMSGRDREKVPKASDSCCCSFILLDWLMIIFISTNRTEGSEDFCEAHRTLYPRKKQMQPL